MAAILGLAGLLLSHSALALEGDPVSVSFRIEGCRNPSVNLEETDFVCADGDYTTGNLGKTWNELDLVPHRVTTTAGNSAPDLQTYKIAIVADYYETGEYGYDVISEPVLNPVHSDPTCEIAVDDEEVLIPGFGGTEQSLYRFVTVTQPKNTVCVLDYWQRLAVGASRFPGASLHSNLGNQLLTTGGIGNKDVSIPVNEILPQEVSKTMDAIQDVDYVWNVTKDPTPVSLDFGDTCAPGALGEAPVTIRIQWVKLPAEAGMINVLTNIYVKNPALRLITVNVTDVIYSGDTEIDSALSGEVDIPGNTEQLILTHTVAVAEGTVGLRDVATASYVDKFSGVPVPGTTHAEASADVQVGDTLNGTATITDVEWIEGAGLSFSVEAVRGAGGAFDGYTLGARTVGDVVWTSDTQEGAGYVEFDKIVYLEGPAITSGVLRDVALLDGSDDFQSSATADVAISSNATVELAISKTIPDVLQGAQTASFTFDVSGPDGYSQSVTLDFGAGDTAKSTTLSGLMPGFYNVSEQEAAGWMQQPDQGADLSLPTCNGGVEFNNIVMTPEIRARKVTEPAGTEGGWCMTLTGPGISERACTGADGIAEFTSSIVEGSYTITEDMSGVSGWQQTGSSNCEFDVDLPIAPGTVIECAMENTQLGSITVEKFTNPADSDQEFSFTFNPPEGDDVVFPLVDKGNRTFGDLLPGAYAVSEALPANGEWELDPVECSGGHDPASIQLAAGEHVTCTYRNIKKGKIIVVKTTAPADTGDGFGFEPSWGDGFELIDGMAHDSGLLSQGTYSVAEVSMPDGWYLDSSSCDDGSDPASIGLDAGETVTCTFHNVKRGKINVHKATTPDTTDKFDFSATFETAFQLGNGGDYFSGWLEIDQVYTVREIGLDAAWAQVRAECTDDGQIFDIDPAGINLEAGQVVDCYFENRANAQIKVVKGTLPAGQTYPFDFTSDFMGDFTLGGDGASQTSGYLDPTVTYSVAEVGPDAGWTLISVTCDNGDLPAAIAPIPGQLVTCTFINEMKATVIIHKSTLPAGSTQEFSFDFSGTAFELVDGGSRTFDLLPPNVQYQVGESVPAGWDLSGYQCDRGHTVDNIVPAPGETVNCYFTNQQMGQITVDKVTAPAGSTQLFGFAASFGSFELADQSPVFDTGLISSGGLHNVAELPLAGWDLVEATCVNDKDQAEDPEGFVLDPGEKVDCVFTNVERGKVTVSKTFGGLVNPSYDITFTLSGPELPGGSISLSTLNDLDGVLDFGDQILIPGQTYTMCEYQVNAAWSYLWQLDGIVITPYNPNASDVPPEDLGVRCHDFSVAPGSAASFAIENTPPPEGGPRTIGYWKNWNQCSGGNQAATAAANGGADEGFFLLEDALGDPSTMMLGSLLVADCEMGVALLEKSDIESGKKLASDAAYSLAAQLLAAKANLAVGAVTCQQVVQAVGAADALLSQIHFDGTGTYLGPKDRKLVVLRNEANGLAGTLDSYNNGQLCVAP